MVNLSGEERKELEWVVHDEPLGRFIRKLVLRYMARRRK